MKGSRSPLENPEFDFPLHNQEVVELNLILNAEGTQRIVDNHMKEINDMELLFVGSILSHRWFTHQAKVKTNKNLTFNFLKTCLITSF